MDWQVHVYGDAMPDLKTACDARRLPLHIFPWRHEMVRAGLHRNAIYLVRPDGYVAMANAEGIAAAVTSYLDAHQITPTPDARIGIAAALS